ncbi:hypothetical protein ISF6_4142 [Piscinibacter sakaiensis]|uniref:Uncharacterized protein n=1 Tax=Piscinibacter sakaiensis TaxID=1547922 RepID=A0A0K8P5G0_PISS1|nr:hypothetical protein ISF6_4142 [Piscinibacter sakaiensis]
MMIQSDLDAHWDFPWGAADRGIARPAPGAQRGAGGPTELPGT